jgi:hypothetical protein
MLLAKILVFNLPMFAACVALIFPDGAAPVFFILLDHFLICAGTIRAKTSPAISNVIFSNHLEFLKWDVEDIVEWFFFSMMGFSMYFLQFVHQQRRSSWMSSFAPLPAMNRNPPVEKL